MAARRQPLHCPANPLNLTRMGSRGRLIVCRKHRCHPGSRPYKTFEFDGRGIKHAALVISSNGKSDIWLNGWKILTTGATRTYEMHVITEEQRAALRKGTNTLAIHARMERPAAHLV